MYSTIRFARVPTHMEIVWPALIALRETGNVGNDLRARDEVY